MVAGLRGGAGLANEGFRTSGLLGWTVCSPFKVRVAVSGVTGALADALALLSVSDVDWIATGVPPGSSDAADAFAAGLTLVSAGAAGTLVIAELSLRSLGAVAGLAVGLPLCSFEAPDSPAGEPSRGSLDCELDALPDDPPLASFEGVYTLDVEPPLESLGTTYGPAPELPLGSSTLDLHCPPGRGLDSLVLKLDEVPANSRYTIELDPQHKGPDTGTHGANDHPLLCLSIAGLS